MIIRNKAPSKRVKEIKLSYIFIYPPPITVDNDTHWLVSLVPVHNYVIWYEVFQIYRYVSESDLKHHKHPIFWHGNDKSLGTVVSWSGHESVSCYTFYIRTWCILGNTTLYAIFHRNTSLINLSKCYKVKLAGGKARQSQKDSVSLWMHL